MMGFNIIWFWVISIVIAKKNLNKNHVIRDFS